MFVHFSPVHPLNWSSQKIFCRDRDNLNVFKIDFSGTWGLFSFSTFSFVFRFSVLLLSTHCTLFFITALSRCNALTVPFAHLNCTSRWLLAYSQPPHLQFLDIFITPEGRPAASASYEPPPSLPGPPLLLSLWICMLWTFHILWGPLWLPFLLMMPSVNAVPSFPVLCLLCLARKHNIEQQMHTCTAVCNLPSTPALLDPSGWPLWLLAELVSPRLSPSAVEYITGRHGQCLTGSLSSSLYSCGHAWKEGWPFSRVCPEFC